MHVQALWIVMAVVGITATASGQVFEEDFSGPLDTDVWKVFSTDATDVQVAQDSGIFTMKFGTRPIDGGSDTAGIYANGWQIDLSGDARFKIDFGLDLSGHTGLDIGGVIGFSRFSEPMSEGIFNDAFYFIIEEYFGDWYTYVAIVEDGEMIVYDWLPDIVFSPTGTLYVEYLAESDTVTWSTHGYTEEPFNYIYGITEYTHDPVTCFMGGWNAFNDSPTTWGKIWADNFIIEEGTIVGPDADQGACCTDDENCYILTEDQCGDVDGEYHGNETECEEGLCDIERSPATVLWRNSLTGDNVVWILDGVTFIAGEFITSVADTHWKVAAGGDFDANGSADIFWRNDQTGVNAIWLMDGATVIGGQFILDVGDTNWWISGVGDFNGDSKADVFWRNQTTGDNAVWILDGDSFVDAQFVTSADPQWVGNGDGDFNGDGNADIFWHNTATGQTSVWLMDGVTIIDSASLSTVALTDQVDGVGDFDGDGKSDVLWRNMTSGENTIWFMNGVGISGSFSLDTTVSDLRWSIVGVADFNADGMADIFWRFSAPGDGSDGMNAIWLMEGSEFVNQQFLPAVSEAGWEVVGTLN